MPIVVAVGILALVLSACESSSDETTTTVSASADTTVSTETIVVGGKTPEEYEAELPELEKAVQANDQDLDALQALAIAQFWTGRYAEAAVTYEQMLQIKDDAFTRNNYANVLRKWGKLEEAKAQYEQAIATDPTLTVAYINLAGLLSEQGNNQEALEVLKSGLEKVEEEDKASLQAHIDRLTAPTTT